MTVRMIRKAQIDSSDGAAVTAWISEYTAVLRTIAPSGVEVRAWRQIFGPYGLAFWTFDAPDVGALDDFLRTTTPELGDVLKRGSTLFVSGETSDVLLREID